MKQYIGYGLIIFSAIIVVLFPYTLFAQSIDLDPSAKTIDGITNIAASIVADSFVPMTHYNKDNYMVSIVPAYFTVQKAYDDPEIKGKDLKGYGAGAGFGYATSDRMLIFGIAAYMHFDGRLSSAFYKGLDANNYQMKVDYSIISLYSGIGYDVVESSEFSLPLFAGIFIQKYNGTGTLPEISNIKLSVDSSATLFGVSFGIAPSFKYDDLFKITPYYLVSYSLNKPEATAKITTTVPFPISENYDVPTKNVKASMVGLALTWLSSKSVSLSLSLGGWIRNEMSWYNKTFLNGLQMKSAVLVVSFNN
ncbi:MAG: hypothetical protein AB1444_13110 [Spirochaetota bacterium]